MTVVAGMQKKIMKTKTVSGFFVFLVILAGVGWFFHRFGSTNKNIRNVVLISIDTCRADYLSCYGFERETTPQIDEIARQGLLFKHAQAPAPLTLPAHCSMLTGTYPPYHGVHRNREYQLSDSQVTVSVLSGSGVSRCGTATAFIMAAAACAYGAGTDLFWTTGFREMKWRVSGLSTRMPQTR